MCLLPLTGQTSTNVAASHSLPPRATYLISLVPLISSSSTLKLGGYTTKSANFPREREPSEACKPSVIAPDNVAARSTCQLTGR